MAEKTKKVATKKVTTKVTKKRATRKQTTKKSNKTQTWSRFISGFVLGVIVVFLFFNNQNKQDEMTADNRPSLDRFWDVWEIIEDKHKVVPGSEITGNGEKIHGAIKGLTESLEDPYSTWLPPEDSDIFVSDVVFGSFGGIGVYIESVNGRLTVVSPLEGTPAEKAGLKAKDIIAEIDGESSIDISTREAANRIRGEIGTTVLLSIIREGETENIKNTSYQRPHRNTKRSNNKRRWSVCNRHKKLFTSCH